VLARIAGVAAGAVFTSCDDFFDYLESRMQVETSEHLRDIVDNVLRSSAWRSARQLFGMRGDCRDHLMHMTSLLRLLLLLRPPQYCHLQRVLAAIQSENAMALWIRKINANGWHR
jgi:hypothetical protein